MIGVIFGERSVGERNSRMRNLLTAALSHASASHTRVPARLQVQVAEKRTGTNRTVKITQAVAAAPKEFAEPETPVAPSSKAAAVRPASRSATALARPAPAPQAVAEAAEPSPTAGPVNPLPGPFHVQIGAFGSEAEARQRLGTAMGTAGDVLAGHRAAALAFNAPDRIWYRARFAGFDRPAADQTCLALKARHLECIVMRAD